jgi:hypothetical protein
MAQNRYSKEQVKAMIVNPMVEKPMLEAYPMLETIMPTTFQGTADADKQLRFLSWVYDYNSPAVKEYSDVTRRKIWAKKEVGLTGALSYELTINFLTKVVNNRVWSLICSLESTFIEYTERVNKKIEDDDTGKEIDILKAVEIKNKLLTQMHDMIEKIDNLYSRLFAGDDDLKDEFDERNIFTPEKVAQQFKKR